MSTGTVKWFNATKGYGFINPDDKSGDVFAHYSAIKMDGYKLLKEGDRVRYAVKQGEKGLTAEDIVKIEEDSRFSVLKTLVEEFKE